MSVMNIIGENDQKQTYFNEVFRIFEPDLIKNIFQKQHLLNKPDKGFRLVHGPPNIVKNSAKLLTKI